MSKFWKSGLTALTICGIAHANEFTVIPDVRASANTMQPFQTVSAPNKGTCAGWCAHTETCTAANFNANQETCELHNATGLTWSATSEFELLLKVELTSNNAVSSLYQTVKGVLIHGAQADGFASYTINRTISANHCQRICESVTSSCRLFAYHSTLKMCTISDVDFFENWTTTSGLDSGWTSYYRHANGTESWKLVMKVSKGVGVDIFNGFMNAGNFNLTASLQQMALDNGCSCYLKNQLLDYWTYFPITAVNVSLASKGKEVAYVNLAASNSTKTSFFKPSGLRTSSWSDLNSNAAISTMQFEYYYGQYFTIEHISFSCFYDMGWMVINTITPGYCSYDKSPTPQFAYTSGTTADYMSYAEYADALLIYIQM